MSSVLGLVKKIKINPLFWFIIGIGVLTGYFREVIMVFSIVFVHEMGHSLAAHYYKWRIRKIELLPFGGVAEVDEYGNRPLKEEFVVIVSGPIQHVWLIALSYLLLPFDFWTQVDHQVFIQHNMMIALFNLLPIWPLDGSKLLYLLISLKLPFHRAHTFALKCSFLFLCLFIIISIYIFPFHLNLWIVMIFLLFSHYFEWKQIKYVYMRFLMDRYYNPLHDLRSSEKILVPSREPIKEVLKRFKRGSKHEILINDVDNVTCREISEVDLLAAFFEKQKANLPIGLL